MPNQIVPPGTNQMLATVTSAAAAATLANRFQNAGQRMPCPCASHRLTPDRNRKLPAIIRAK